MPVPVAPIPDSLGWEIRVSSIPHQIKKKKMTTLYQSNPRYRQLHPASITTASTKSNSDPLPSTCVPMSEILAIEIIPVIFNCLQKIESHHIFSCGKGQRRQTYHHVVVWRGTFGQKPGFCFFGSYFLNLAFVCFIYWCFDCDFGFCALKDGAQGQNSGV